MTHNEEAMKYLLGTALDGQRPTKRARDLVYDIRPSRRKRLMWLPAVAAAIVLCLVMSSLTIPAVAWALSHTPLVGGTYARFLEGTGLDIAYQAGLVKELNRTVVHGDFEIVIVAAYRDANQTVVVHQMTSHDPALLAEAWESSSDLMPRFVFPRGWRGSSTMQYIAEANMIYGISHIDPDSWGVFGQTLTMQIPGLDLTLTFPVQNIANSLSETVSVKKTLEYRGMTIRVDEVIFSPSATRVNYTILSSGGAEGSKDSISTIGGVVGEGIAKHPAGVTSHGLNWTIKTESGARLNSLSSGLTNSRDGHVVFMPTDSRSLEIILLGETVSLKHSDTIALETGSSSETIMGVLSVASVVSEPGQTEVQLQWSGEGRLGKSDIQLVDASGTRVRVSAAKQDGTGMRLMFEHGNLSQPVSLEIGNLWIEGSLEIVVATVQR